jgi:predicted naringenin-chalcone synthase
MSFITAIGTAVPAFRFDQSTISKFMEATMAKDDPSAARKIRAVFRASGIQYRHSVIEDYGRTAAFTFYPNHEREGFPATESRMKLFRRHALPLSVAAVQNMLSANDGASLSGVTHLVVVSCTGMYAPGLDIDLVAALHLPGNVQRTCIQFMGCYAAFNALKVADAFCKSQPGQKVLIVCTELCSIHFQHQSTDDNILANALFADGAASMIVEDKPSGKANLEMLSFHNDVAFTGSQHMAWHIGNEGFEMRLSAYIPDLIKVEIEKLISKLLSTLKKTKDDMHFFALHPGGVKILQAIEERLGLKKEDNAESYEVLRNFGNMSSATVVFVLREILSKLTSRNNGEDVLSMGFGPGLTLESMLLRIKML